MNNFDEEVRFSYVCSVARAAIADDLRDYPWEQLPPAQAHAIYVTLPPPKLGALAAVLRFPNRPAKS